MGRYFSRCCQRLSNALRDSINSVNERTLWSHSLRCKTRSPAIHIDIYIHVYKHQGIKHIQVYIRVRTHTRARTHTHAHTHTHVYIYIHTHTSVNVCMCLCGRANGVCVGSKDVLFKSSIYSFRRRRTLKRPPCSSRRRKSWLDRWMDGWMDGWTDGKMYGWIEGRRKEDG